MKQLDRVFLLHQRLSGRRTGTSVDDLLELLREHKLGRTKSTLKRALAFLRDRLHAPLVHDPERGGYLYEGDGRHELPGLWFTAQELAALLVFEEVIAQQPQGLLSDTLRPFRARLEKLAQKSGIGIPQWRSRLRLLRMAARPAGAQFAVVAEALARRRRLHLDYHARSDDRMAPRTVSPQRLTLYRDNWYLDAWCHTRKDLRIFALDRMVSAEVLGEPAIEIAEARLNDTLATSYGIFAGTPTATAVLRFSPRAARWIAAETWHPQQQDTREEDGALTRCLPYHRSEELVMDILRHGPDVQVLEPETLASEVATRLRDALAQYAAAGTRGGHGSAVKKPLEAPDSAKQGRAPHPGSAGEPGSAYARSQKRTTKTSGS